MKHRIFLALLLCLSLMTGCVAGADGLDLNDMFSKRDLRADYDPADSIAITLNGSSAACSVPSVKISGSTVTITDDGTYILRGTLDNGMIIVDADDEKVQIVLDGAHITSATSAPLYVRQADKVVVTLAEGSENTLKNGGAFVAIDNSDIDAAVYSRDDITLNGSGSLTVESPAGHGIVSNDDLILTGGAITVNAASHGLSANDSVRMRDVTMAITAGKDGIQAEHDDPEDGYVYMESGTLDIISGGDGISATGEMLLTGGTVSITSNGGSSGESNSSCKGLKAGGNLTVTGGTYAIDAGEDALHTNASLTVSGGTITASAGDDALHADADLTISGGTISVPTSAEGIEGHRVTISGGTITVNAADDGLNAAGPQEISGHSADPDAYIRITGGDLFINADGDGIDSNGDLTVSGGSIVVAGPTRGGNSAVDYSGSAAITGGTMIAYGTSDMAQGFGKGSTQGAILLDTGSMPAGTDIVLSDGSSELMRTTAEKAFSCVLVSVPGMVQNGTYTVSVGSESHTVSLDGYQYSNVHGRFRH